MAAVPLQFDFQRAGEHELKGLVFRVFDQEVCTSVFVNNESGLEIDDIKRNDFAVFKWK
jgi:hypothetical protein